MASLPQNAQTCSQEGKFLTQGPPASIAALNDWLRDIISASRAVNEHAGEIDELRRNIVEITAGSGGGGATLMQVGFLVAGVPIKGTVPFTEST